MDADEWALWQRLNPQRNTLNLRYVVDRPCSDCPASFARQMRAVGRCNGETPEDLPVVPQRWAA